MKNKLISFAIIIFSITFSISLYANAVIAPGVNALPYKMEKDTKVFTLVAEPVTKTIHNKNINNLQSFEVPLAKKFKKDVMNLPIMQQQMKGWGYNGNIPGPTIIAKEGEHVKIKVINKLPEPTTVHWHGLIVPNKEDGAGDVSQKIIAPGASDTYEFTIVNKPGTYLYHSGFNDTKQVGKGLSGFFIVLPKKEEKVQFKDFAILLQGWSIKQNSENINFLSMDNDWFTFNGLTAPNFPVLKVNEGDHVRLRFANMGLVPHPIHLHGYSFEITGTEGGPIKKSARWPSATVMIASGQTRTVEFVANNPGVWRLHCHILHHIINDHPYFENKKIKLLPEGGMYTYLYVKPKKI